MILIKCEEERYPYKDDIPCNLGRWTAAEKVTHFLRELAVQEINYFDVDNVLVHMNPDHVLCQLPMLQKFLQSAARVHETL